MFFFVQAEDGIRDADVTGVQTCALPIYSAAACLVEQQNPDGSWNEQEFTGTGFPRVFYLKYHLYRIYFPLYALARYRNILQGSSEYRSLVVQPGELERRNGNREIG